MIREPSGRPIAVLLTVLVALTVGVGLYLVGSPGTAREQALDDRRVLDLRETRQEVSLFWQQHRALPAAIDSVGAMSGDTVAHRDPVTGARYEYRITGDSTYHLCAMFTHPSRNAYPADDTWQHPAGRHCYPIRIGD